MWQNPETALALHRARVAEATRRLRPRRDDRVHPAAAGLALWPAAVPWAR